MKKYRYPFIKFFIICFIFSIIFADVICADNDSLISNEEYVIYNGEFTNLINIETEVSAVGKEYNWSFPYSDEFFSIPENEYCHTFAQASLALAASAFRPKTGELIHHADNIKNYFSKIGFTDVDADSYEIAPAADTITSAIAHKQIGDYTVIALVCAGANYGKEWAGNFNVGDAERHEGFDYAAGIVEERLKEYIEKYNITGDIRLWTSGFSRAAAVSNILSADMTDSGIFTKVYGYSFATPRTTRESGNYDNIFCIIGKDDPVPMIPLADWGYGHYGIELYTPTQEADSAFIEKVYAVSGIMEAVAGDYYRNNPELNYEFRTVLNYLYELMPESSIYVDRLQSELIEFMSNSEPDIGAIITKIIESFVPETEAEKSRLSTLYEYVEIILSKYVLQGNEVQKKDGSWDASAGLTGNLFLEHNVSNYIAWMFSQDNPLELFSENTGFSSVIIEGDVEINVYDINGQIVSVDKNGKATYPDTEVVDENGEAIVMPELFVMKNGDGISVTIPNDRFYVIAIQSNNEQSIVTTVINYSDDSIVGKVNIINVDDYKNGDEFYLMYSTQDSWEMYNGDGDVIQDIYTADAYDFSEYNASIIMRLQNVNAMHLSLGNLMLMIIITLAVFALLVLLSIILVIIRLIRRKKRKALPTVIMHLINVAVLVVMEIQAWYFIPAFPIVRMILQVLSYISIIILVLKAIKSRKRKSDSLALLIMVVVMAAAVVLEMMYIGRISFLKIIIVSVVDLAFIITACITWRKKAEVMEIKATDETIEQKDGGENE